MKNVKDTITSICGGISVVCAAVLGVAAAGVILPVAVVTTCTVALGVSGSLVAYFTGKNPNGTTKSDGQVVEQNQQSK